MNYEEMLGPKKKRRKRIARGPSSGMGKTAGRGEKGAGSRSGYKRRHGYIGGGVRLHTKLPTRGFTRGRFLKDQIALNLSKIECFFNDGETVSIASLREKKIISSKKNFRLKILSNGEITKKVKIEAHFFSANAEKKLNEKSISYKVLAI